MSRTYEGFFLIADITGYTRYLSESELEHAQETLTALLELLVEKTRPPLVISRLAGDAVISYLLRERTFAPQTFIEKIEDTYVAFRKRIELLVRNNRCHCNACANIGKLDLKFFVHYGRFGIQRIADHDELVGSDVNLIHRLLKNTVTDQLGVSAYTLYSDAAVQQLGSEELLQAMTPHSESYEHLGEVQVWVQDMHPVWRDKRESVRVEFPADRIWKQWQTVLHMPREQAWNYLVQPEYRNSLIGSDRMLIANRDNGRVGPGSIYQCYHGDMMVPQTVMEWQPFHSMIVREQSPFSAALGGLSEYILEDIAEGTRLSKSSARPDGPLWARILLRVMMLVFDRVGHQNMEKFRVRAEADFHAQDVAPTPEADVSAGQIREAAAASLSNPSENESSQ